MSKKKKKNSTNPAKGPASSRSISDALRQVAPEGIDQQALTGMEALADLIYDSSWKESRDCLFDVRSSGHTHTTMFESQIANNFFGQYEVHPETTALVWAQLIWVTDDLVGVTQKPTDRPSRMARKMTYMHDNGYTISSVTIRGSNEMLYLPNVHDHSTEKLAALFAQRASISEAQKAVAYIGFLIESSRCLSDGFRDESLDSLKRLLALPNGIELTAGLFTQVARDRAVQNGMPLDDQLQYEMAFLHTLKKVDEESARKELFNIWEIESDALAAFSALYAQAA